MTDGPGLHPLKRSTTCSRISVGVREEKTLWSEDPSRAPLSRHRSSRNVLLGSVEIHRELMTAATRWIMARYLLSVLSALLAMRLNSLSLQKKFSMRWRHLYISVSICSGVVRRGC